MVTAGTTGFSGQIGSGKMPLVRIPLYIPFKRRQDLFHGTSNVGGMIFTWGEEKWRLPDGDVGVISISEAEGRKDRRPGLEGDLDWPRGERGKPAEELERLPGVQNVTIHGQHH